MTFDFFSRIELLEIMLYYMLLLPYKNSVSKKYAANVYSLIAFENHMRLMCGAE